MNNLNEDKYNWVLVKNPGKGRKKKSIRITESKRYVNLYISQGLVKEMNLLSISNSTNANFYYSKERKAIRISFDENGTYKLRISKRGAIRAGIKQILNSINSEIFPHKLEYKSNTDLYYEFSESSSDLIIFFE